MSITCLNFPMIMKKQILMSMQCILTTNFAIIPPIDGSLIPAALHICLTLCLISPTLNHSPAGYTSLAAIIIVSWDEIQSCYTQCCPMEM